MGDTWSDTQHGQINGTNQNYNNNNNKIKKEYLAGPLRHNRL